MKLISQPLIRLTTEELRTLRAAEEIFEGIVDGLKDNKENGFTAPQYQVLQGNLTDKVSGKFDVVVANIVADVIVMFCKQVGAFMKDNAVFITSGIIDTLEQDVLDAFKENGFTVTERNTDRGWVCFTCVRDKR